MIKNLLKFSKKVRMCTQLLLRKFLMFPKEKVDKEMRRKAKVINFGIMYGMGVNALKGNLSGQTIITEARPAIGAVSAKKRRNILNEIF